MIRWILALLLPWLMFFTIGRPLSGLICLLLQITLIGWFPAALWACLALNGHAVDKKLSGLTGGK